MVLVDRSRAAVLELFSSHSIYGETHVQTGRKFDHQPSPPVNTGWRT